MTPFQQRVYEALGEIPSGRVTTYQALAARVGCGSAQAVGQALRKNPFAPRVPCHRVIRKDLQIGGFHGVNTGSMIQKKIDILASEGVYFEEGRLRDPRKLFEFPHHA